MASNQANLHFLSTILYRPLNCFAGKLQVNSTVQCVHMHINFASLYCLLALINQARGLYGRILTEVVSTDSTDRLGSANKMFIIWQKQV